jgi:hypothetical protein
MARTLPDLDEIKHRKHLQHLVQIAVTKAILHMRSQMVFAFFAFFSYSTKIWLRKFPQQFIERF